MVTKTEKLLNVLASGQNTSATTIAKKTKLQNVSSTIHRLREQGYEIYTNKRSDGYYYRWNIAA